MRTYLFTSREKRLLILWLQGKLTRRHSAHLNVLLSLVNKHQSQLLGEIHMLIKVLRRLHRTS